MKPFLGLPGEKAKEALEKNKNIQFTSTEISTIDNANKNIFAKALIAKYEKDTGKSLNDLPTNVQTGIYSVVYNYWINSIKTKGALANFWDAIKGNNLPKASKILANKKVIITEGRQKWVNN